jgi:hypothetical protein
MGMPKIIKQMKENNPNNHVKIITPEKWSKP